MKTESQNKLVLKRLQEGKPISQLWAIKYLNCFRLSARICDLRRKGHDIKTRMVEHNDKRFALYTMEI